MLKKLSATLTALCALALTLTFANCGTSSSRPAGVVLVSSQGDNTLLAYRADLTSGKLTQINTSASTTDVPSAVVFDPGGAFAYVATSPSSGGGKVLSIPVGSDGKLGSSGSSVDLDSPPSAMTIDGAGHLFVLTEGDPIPTTPVPPKIFSLSAASGSLSKVSEQPAGADPSSATVATSGGGSEFVYVTNQGDNNVSQFSVDGSGILTEITNAGNRYPTSTAPSGSSLATTTTGAYLYVANSGSNNITAFVVCLSTIAPCTAADGSLIKVAASPFGAGLMPVGIVVDPTNTFVYALDQSSNQVSQYRLNAANGALSALSPATVSTGARPVSIAFHPDGKYLYVVNSTSDTISGYSVEAQNGVLSPVTPLATSSLPFGLAVK